MSSFSPESGIEALLFISGEPVSIMRLKTLLDIENDEVMAEALKTLRERYLNDASSGLMLIEHDGKVELATKPALATLVEALTKSTLQESLSKAALEVLSIIAYRSPIARSEIEAIRGVNCSYTIRALLLRGLVERSGNPEDARGYIYRPSFAFLEHLGLSSVEALPDYTALSTDPRMKIIAEEKQTDESTHQSPVS